MTIKNVWDVGFGWSMQNSGGHSLPWDLDEVQSNIDHGRGQNTDIIR